MGVGHVPIILGTEGDPKGKVEICTLSHFIAWNWQARRTPVKRPYLLAKDTVHNPVASAILTTTEPVKERYGFGRSPMKKETETPGRKLSS